MQVKTSITQEHVYTPARVEELQPVLPGRTRARRRRRALVAPDRAGAARARAAPLLGSPRKLGGCGTNILAARLKELERHGVVSRRRLEPPAASTVYELTAYGQELRPVHAHARALGRTLARPAHAGRGPRARLARGCDAEWLFPRPRRLRGSSFGSATRSHRSSTASLEQDRSRIRTRSSSAIRSRSSTSSSTTISTAWSCRATTLRFIASSRRFRTAEHSAAMPESVTAD